MKDSGNILFCGVGGQGIVLASEVSARALAEEGFDVKSSEVHGMAQRGGPVVSHLRYGKRVLSPVIGPGGADIAVAFELMEPLRYIEHLKPGGLVILNKQKILPMSVTTGMREYPCDILGQLEKRHLCVCPIDAIGMARSLGEARVLSMVMVGALSCLLPVGKNVFLNVVSSSVPHRFVAANLKAFEAGRNIAAEKLSSRTRTMPRVAAEAANQ